MHSGTTRLTSPKSIIESTARLLVFTRTPVPGEVKTRLSCALGADRAAAVYTGLLRDTLETARRSAVGDIQLWCTPTTRHPVLEELANTFSLSLQTQAGAGLGERMFNAMEHALETCRYALLVGSDCIDLAATDIDLALDKLAAGYDVALGPARDGGYYLVGLGRPHRQLFTDITWGTDTVLQVTRQRVSQLQLSAYELPLRRDLDSVEDLPFYRQSP